MNQFLRLITLLFCVLSLLTPFIACPVVIIVHGSFSSKDAWWRVNGGFFNEVEKQAKAKGHCVVPFSWSGQPTEKEIRAGGAMLAKLIESYPISEHIILIGHSHGGNVINHASKLLFDPLEKLLAEMAQKPVSEVLAQACAAIAAAPPQNNQQYIPVPVSQLHWWDLLPTVKLLALAENKSPSAGQKRYVIDRIYLLGTPTNNATFGPQMEVVGDVFNFFSYGDIIQPVLGLYQRTYPQHQRLINLEVLVWDHNKKKVHKPDHHDIHAAEIGRWLLAIPDDLKLLGARGFEKFKFGIDAKIVFRIDGPPEFVV